VAGSVTIYKVQVSNMPWIFNHTGSQVHLIFKMGLGRFAVKGVNLKKTYCIIILHCKFSKSVHGFPTTQCVK
jgi:hypothetical protein